MSELLSDMKDVLKERVSGPFFGYIFISFIIFNWDWFYFFIFSNLSAEQKLKTISVTYSYFRGVVSPVASGFLLCLAAPFINVGIKKLHSIAIRFGKEIDYDNDNSFEIIKADRELKISIKRQESSIIKSEVDRLEKDHKKLDADISNMQHEIANLTIKKLDLGKNEQQLIEKINEMTLVLQDISATKENFNRLNDLIKEKTKEKIELESKINTLESNLNDISKYIEINNGSRIQNLSLSKKVEKILEPYGYDKNRKKIDNKELAPDIENLWSISTPWSFGQLAKDPMKEAWGKTFEKRSLGISDRILGQQNLSSVIPKNWDQTLGLRNTSALDLRLGVNKPAEMINTAAMGKSQKINSGVHVRKASKLKKVPDIADLQQATTQLDDSESTTPKKIPQTPSDKK